MLPAGARVAVVTPAGIPDPARLAAGMALISDWGLVPVPGAALGQRHRYFAGDREARLADLRWALTAPDIDAVWFGRGGSGTAQLLASLPLDSIDQRPIFGFSDATALFCALGRRGWPVHAPVLHSLADGVDEASQRALQAWMAGAPSRLPGRWLCGPTEAVEAPVLGGNLCVLASLCGTPHALQAAGSILLIEDIGEPPYKIDRLLRQLQASGALDGVVGVAVGELTGCAPPAGADWTVQDMLIEVLQPLGVPVVVGLPVGHGRENHCFSLGAQARLHEGGLDVANR